LEASACRKTGVICFRVQKRLDRMTWHISSTVRHLAATRARAAAEATPDMFLGIRIRPRANLVQTVRCAQNENAANPLDWRRLFGCGGRIRTCDLQVMSLTSYRAAPPRVQRSEVRPQGAIVGGLGSGPRIGKRVVRAGSRAGRGVWAGGGRLAAWGFALCALLFELWTSRQAWRRPALPPFQRAVPWARCGFTAEFGMGSGGARTL
jgi:hypothetical protein